MMNDKNQRSYLEGGIYYSVELGFVFISSFIIYSILAGNVHNRKEKKKGFTGRKINMFHKHELEYVTKLRATCVIPFRGAPEESKRSCESSTRARYHVSFSNNVTTPVSVEYRSIVRPIFLSR
jgi:hypothetical protein